MSAASTLHIRLIRHLRKWHRKLGILAAFFLIFLSVTGIALNHTDELTLAHHPVKNEWLLNHYGIKPPTDIRFYHQNNLLVTNNLAWLDKQLLLESDEAIITMGLFNDIIFIITENIIYLYNEQGQLIDQLDSSMGIPQNISHVSISNSYLLVKTPQGYFQTDADFFDWQVINTLIEPEWLTHSEVSLTEKSAAIIKYKSQYLNWERIILDTHSGRFFGYIGVLFMDMVGILLILLSLSGIYIWIRYSRAKR